MSSSERGSCARRAPLRLAAALVAGLAAASGCTVQPLYSTAPISTSSVRGSVGAELSTIAIRPPTNRIAQEVRNHLIFLFNGGKGEPSEPRYTLRLNVLSINEPTANVQINRQNEPTAAMLTARAYYQLIRADGTPVSSGNRQFAASYDVPRQEFAALRAKLDAEDRAAREVAELIRMAVAQDLSRNALPPRAPKTAEEREPKSIF